MIPTPRSLLPRDVMVHSVLPPKSHPCDSEGRTPPMTRGFPKEFLPVPSSIHIIVSLLNLADKNLWPEMWWSSWLTETVNQLDGFSTSEGSDASDAVVRGGSHRRNTPDLAD